MKTKSLFIVFVLLLAFSLQGAAATCTKSLQAGTFVAQPGQNTITFDLPFCETPVLVATGDEATQSVKIGVLSPKLGVLFVESDAPVKVYWMAALP